VLSTLLIQRIEGHADQLAASVLRVLLTNEDLVVHHSLSENELYDWVWNIVTHLSEWLTEKTDDDIRARYEELGRQRFRAGIPLHEVVLALQIIKDRVFAFARSEYFGDTALALYGREELELSVSHFFDRCVYYVVRGYEQALAASVRMAT
jgi:hypothetical protein